MPRSSSEKNARTSKKRLINSEKNMKRERKKLLLLLIR